VMGPSGNLLCWIEDDDLHEDEPPCAWGREWITASSYARIVGDPMMTNFAIQSQRVGERGERVAIPERKRPDV
jgi:hypothetical protein